MAKEKIKKTGFSTETADSFLINAGAVYTDLTYSEEDGWEGNRLGATSGGNQITIENEYREIEVDGTFTKYVGQKVLMASNATLTTNVKEVTAEAIRMAINGVKSTGTELEGGTGYDVVTGKGRLENSDYLPNIGLVGEISGSTEPVIVILDNALCTSGLEFSTTDDDEAVITLTFEAHADAGQIADRTLPARIYFPKVV